jgi:response regulator NasT
MSATLRILIAEDETIIRLDLRELLERAGFEVVAEARDGEEAVELARSAAPDLALLDVKMPRLDGIEAARRILDERAIPIVMVTAYGEEELVARAVEAGVFGYLVKPFRESDLLPAIATARARHEELVALREEADSLAEALAARKAIERAKGLLMEREGLTENEAFARLRKASQISGRPLRVVAEALIATRDADSAAARSRSSSRRRRVRRVAHAAAATRANGAAAIATARRTTPSQASTASALSSARSSRDPEPGATAPVSFVRRSSWTVAFRASAAVAARLARSSRSSARAWARCSSSRARSEEVSARSIATVSAAIRARTRWWRRSSPSGESCRSSIWTFWARIVPRLERRVTASAAFADGTLSVIDAAPSSPVA